MHRGHISEADAAFIAGSAIKTLDDLLRTDPVWAGCFRARQGLKCAVSAVRLIGRTESEQNLRDAVYLCAAGDQPGPAGNVALAFQKLATGEWTVNNNHLTEFAQYLSFRNDQEWQVIADSFDLALQSARAVPFVIAEFMTEMLASRPDLEILAWLLADKLLAEKLGWTKPVPLLFGERYGASFRMLGGRGRVLPGNADFGRSICLALVSGIQAGLQTARDIARRAETLLAVAPKLRTKGGNVIIRQLLNEDALFVTAPDSQLSRWASRRLFDRLESLNAVRELSGRSSFRIYGL